MTVRPRAVFLVLIILLAGGSTIAHDEHAPFSMDDFRWQHRPLLILAPRLEDGDYVEQLELLGGEDDALIDRDMAVIHVGGDGGCVDFIGPRSDDRPRQRPLGRVDVQRLRSRYGVSADDFAVLLIGKDGGVKLRSAEPVPSRRIFDLIDSMPMRKREMRDQ